MTVDLESFREGYKLRARICELEGSCSPHAADRFFRAFERNVGNSMDTSFLEYSCKQAVQIINLFSEIDQSVLRISSSVYEGLFSQDLLNLRKMRDDFHRELKRIYSAKEGVISSVDKDGVIRSFVYPQPQVNA